MLRLAHLADGTGPGLQGLRPIGSQLLHFFPSEEELEGEAKPMEDEPAHQDSPLPQTCTQSQTRPLHQAETNAHAAFSVPTGILGMQWGHSWVYLSVGPGLVSAWALFTPREMRSPLSMWPKGSVHFSVSKKSRALSREHHVRWKSAGRGGGQQPWSGHPTGCPPMVPTLTLFALLGSWELEGGHGPVQVPTVCHWLCDLIVDSLQMRFLCAGTPCGELR